MIEVNPSRWKLPPWAHQLRGVRTLLTHQKYGLFWKPRLGKSATIINTACTLFEAGGDIDTVVLVAPAQVKDIWIDKNLGEFKTHDWSGAPVYEYNNRSFDTLVLPWGVCCYVAASVEYLRQQGPSNNFPFVDSLLAALSGRRVWLVFDEGSVLGNHKSLNTKAMIELRKSPLVKRVTVLDGTPMGNSHLSFYSKFKVIDPAILGCKVFEHYRARYSELVKVPHSWLKDDKGHFVLDDKGQRIVTKMHLEVVKEKNMEDFIRRTKPYCEFLEQDALDMPKKVPGVLLVKMPDKAWKVYTQMRDEMIAELDNGIATVGQAAVKCMRLAQICSGFLGGVQENQQMGLGIDNSGVAVFGTVSTNPITVEVHDAPTAMLFGSKNDPGWLIRRFDEDPAFKCVIWSRFVPEIERLVARLQKYGLPHGVKYSKKDSYDGQLHPRSEYNDGYVLVCQPQSAQYGNNFSKAATSLFLSQDYNRITRAQAGDRVQADGTGRFTTHELDVIVTGPRGQKTVVHDIIAVVQGREDAEKRTAEGWKRILLEE